MASTGGFAFVAPVLSAINADLGPSASITWLALVYTLCLAVGLLLVGRLSDIFGRRYFFISGTVLGMIGAIIGATAKTLPVLIGGQTLVGLSACTGYSYAFLVGELVPVKYRFLANAVLFAFSLPSAGFGAAVSTAFVLFILGLSSGGSVYPWKDAHTISFIVVGFLCLVGLFVYESVVDLKEPMVPLHLFKNRGYVASFLTLSLGASVYYSQAIIWPEMTANVYANGREMWSGWVACLVGLGITVGEMIGGACAKMIGKTKYQLLVVITLGTLFLGLMAVNSITSSSMAMAFVFIATTCIGYNEALVLPICSICIKDQQEIGTAVGFAGSARSAISTVASTVYTVVLTARSTDTITAEVPSALVKAGLPASSVADYMTAITAGATEATLSAVKGLTPAIEQAGALAYRHAYLDAYRTVFYVSIAFGGVAILVTFFVPNIDHLMSDSIAATLQSGKTNINPPQKDVHEQV
ncbi:MFS general substrate transporter [Rhizodiscina lignyota]|uniref:MFS general substrate transporter n=1 Tax=Rhizodiscina lignyota TaxID=1504668 RepID=A0A9P4IHA4_9PEZI|nr:MFS general substrate transporter [Rhizodiscina lignyota]